MRRAPRKIMVIIATLSLLLLPAAASAHPDEEFEHDDSEPAELEGTGLRESTQNMHAMGSSEHPATFWGALTPDREVSSDIAFWGKYAIHGNYDGFRIVDVSSPDDPQLVSHPRCNGDQGDIVVWEHIVVRSWNSPAPTLEDGTSGRFCLGEPVPPGFEGVHLFDISNPLNPALLGAVEFSAAGPDRGEEDGCGSHTVTLAPDVDNGRLIVYSNNSSGGRAAPAICNNIDILEVPLADPASASHIGRVPLTGGSRGSNNGCHDAGVILGDVNLLACASGHAANVFSIGAPGGGTLTEPRFLYTVEEEEFDEEGNLVGKVGVGGRWHSAAFTWDGEMLILGWEPGGGARARCQEDNPDIDKSMFFYDARTGKKLGQWVLPRAQEASENCTVHNFNVVPLRDGRYVAAGGHYQAGTWVVDFTDPANPQTIAYSDPDTLGTVTRADNGHRVYELGGAWSSYWYNGFVYESDITTGLNVFRVSDQTMAGEVRVPHLNPQTMDPAVLARGKRR